jgi:UDP-N-acetylglucosamine 4-epimerase
MAAIESAEQELQRNPRTWLVTGVAGFIGSNLLQKLLSLGQTVVGLDNLSTGKRTNLEETLASVPGEQAEKFRFVEGDIGNYGTCLSCCEGIDVVLHQAALGSVSRSIENPIETNRSNVDGFLNIILAAKEQRVQRFVYAASSSTYGDHPALPKVEDRIGRPLSPYAVTKYVNELYASVFNRVYGLNCIGLRYFNVFGRRQDPSGAYAAVIPRWFSHFLGNGTIEIFGDGETSRDFCYVENVVQANVLAASVSDPEALNTVYNIGFGERTSLNDLFFLIREQAVKANPSAAERQPSYRDFRAGDVRHSLADITKARKLLGYNPKYSVRDGLVAASGWYFQNRRPIG